jgi:hypothetical protein
MALAVSPPAEDGSWRGFPGASAEGSRRTRRLARCPPCASRLCAQYLAGADRDAADGDVERSVRGDCDRSGSRQTAEVQKRNSQCERASRSFSLRARCVKSRGPCGCGDTEAPRRSHGTPPCKSHASPGKVSAQRGVYIFRASDAAAGPTLFCLHRASFRGKAEGLLPGLPSITMKRQTAAPYSLRG